MLWREDTEVGRMKKEFNCPNCSTKLNKKKCQTILVSEFDEGLDKVIKSKKYLPVLIKYSAKGKKFFKKIDEKDLQLNKQVENATVIKKMPIIQITRR